MHGLRLRHHVPAIIVASCALLGHVSHGVALLGLFVGELVGFTGAVVLFVIVAWRVGRGQPFRAPLWGLQSVLAAMALLAAATIHGVPQWTRERAEVLITAVESWKATHGAYPAVSSLKDDFPDELRPALKASRCFYYQPRDDSYSITCPGIIFTKCTWDGKTRMWWGWD